MADLKHVGRLKNNQRKIIVAYRTLPGDPYNALVVPTESLDADQHDKLMELVQSNTGQTAYELAEAMARVRLADGRIMLAAFVKEGKLTKVPTSTVEMTPNTTTAIGLDELNKVIAEQKGVPIEELAIKDSSSTQQTTATETVTEPVVEPVVAETAPLSDEELAASYRSQADRLFKEAKALREQAEALVPTKKKTQSA